VIALSSRWVYVNVLPLNNFAREGGDSERRGMMGEKSG